MEDNFWWKTTFIGIHPLVEDDLRWKTTFSGRRLLVEDDPFMLPSPLCVIFVNVDVVALIVVTGHGMLI